MKNKKILLIIMLLLILPITGCTKYVKTENKQMVVDKETGERLVSNILCKPKKRKYVKII